MDKARIACRKSQIAANRSDMNEPHSRVRAMRIPTGRNPFVATTSDKTRTTPCRNRAAGRSETFPDRRHKDSRTAWRGRLDRGESSPPRAMKE
jgi:hypothetical protein